MYSHALTGARTRQVSLLRNGSNVPICPSAAASAFAFVFVQQVTGLVGGNSSSYPLLLDAAGGDTVVLIGAGFNPGDPLHRYTARFDDGSNGRGSGTVVWTTGVRALSHDSVACTTPSWPAAAQVGYHLPPGGGGGSVSVSLYYDGSPVAGAVGGMLYRDSFRRVWPTEGSAAAGFVITVEGNGFESADWAYKCVLTAADGIPQHSAPAPADDPGQLRCVTPAWMRTGAGPYAFDLLKCTLSAGDFPGRVCSAIGRSRGADGAVKLSTVSPNWQRVVPARGWEDDVGLLAGASPASAPFQHARLQAALLGDMVQLRGVVYPVQDSATVVLAFAPPCPQICGNGVAISPATALGREQPLPLECPLQPGWQYMCVAHAADCGRCIERAATSATAASGVNVLLCKQLNRLQCLANSACWWETVKLACSLGQVVCPAARDAAATCLESNNATALVDVNAFAAEVERGLTLYLSLPAGRLRAVNAATTFGGALLVKIAVDSAPADSDSRSHPSAKAVIAAIERARQCRGSSACANARPAGQDWVGLRWVDPPPLRLVRPFAGLTAVLLPPPPPPPTRIQLYILCSGGNAGRAYSVAAEDIAGDLALLARAFSGDAAVNGAPLSKATAENTDDLSWMQSGVLARAAAEAAGLLLQVAVRPAANSGGLWASVTAHQAKSVIDMKAAAAWGYDLPPSVSTRQLSPVVFAKKLLSVLEQDSRNPENLLPANLMLRCLLPGRVKTFRFGTWTGPVERLIATLPLGLRPEARTILPSLASRSCSGDGGPGSGRIDILTDGRIILTGPTCDGELAPWVSLDGVAFKVSKQKICPMQMPYNERSGHDAHDDLAVIQRTERRLHKVGVGAAEKSVLSANGCLITSPSFSEQSSINTSSNLSDTVWAQKAPPLWDPVEACSIATASGSAPGVGYRRTGGLVQLRGAAACLTDGACSALGQLLTLPPGMRPLQALTFAVAGGGGGDGGDGLVRVDVLPDGRVLFAGAVVDSAAVMASAGAVGNSTSNSIDFEDAAQRTAVRIRSDVDEPAYGWQTRDLSSKGSVDWPCDTGDLCCKALWEISHSTIGRVTRVDQAVTAISAAGETVAGGDAWVDFPPKRAWRAAAGELVRSAPPPWASVDGVAIPVLELFPGLLVRIITASPVYGFEQGLASGAPELGDVGVVIDVGPMSPSALSGYAGAAVAAAASGAGLGPEDVLVSFRENPFWRGLRSEFAPVSSPTANMTGWPFVSANISTSSSATFVPPWTSAAPVVGGIGGTCLGGGLSGLACSVDADCRPTGAVAGAACTAQAGPFYVAQGGRTYLFGTVAVPGPWGPQPVIAHLPPAARPATRARIFRAVGGRRSRATASAASAFTAAAGGGSVGIASSTGLFGVWVRIHHADGRMEVAGAGSADLAWISLSGISFDSGTSWIDD